MEIESSFRRNLLIALATVASSGAAGVEWTAWQAGGAGGTVALGAAALVLGVGAPVGGIVALDDPTVARLGFWPEGLVAASVPVQPPSIASVEPIHAAYDGSTLLLELHAEAPTQASIRLVGIDGRAVEPTWSGALAVGTTRRSIDLARHRGQVLFLLVEVGVSRRTYQIHDVSR